MSQSTIPLSLPVDRMAKEISPQEKHVAPSHPVQASLKNFEASESKRKNFTMAHVFGSAMPMSLLMEQELVSHPLRLPGLQSSNLGLEVLQDGLVNFDFKDYLNQPELSDMPDIDLHAQMQNKLGIQVKLQF